MDFDKFSGNYSEILNRNIRISGESSEYFTEYKVKTLKSFYTRNGINASGKILDVGCGIGKIEYFLPVYFPKLKIYGIDPSVESIDTASSKNQNCIFHAYNGIDIPFQNNSFDAAILSNVLHHILPIERRKNIVEIYRILNKNGYLFIFEHNPFNPVTRYIVKNCEFDADAHLVSQNNCIKLLKALGFQIVEARYIVFFPKALKLLRPLEEHLGFLPLGAQYFIAAQK